ncbi:MAG: sulfurtransferase TusA family protein [Chloroflexi bacterium]|nr:sulfurtransferase TusA family protein [Chloroflexota bacterium]
MAESTVVPVLDVRGEICPYPMLRTNKELDEVRPGVAELDVITDHPPALSTIPPEAMKRGYGVEIEEVREGEWKIRLFKDS